MTSFGRCSEREFYARASLVWFGALALIALMAGGL